MKKIGLLFSALILTGSLFAQNYTDEYMPHATIIGKERNWNEMMRKACENRAIRHYLETQVTGFQQSHAPKHIFTSIENRYMIAVGGFVNFRTAYDFDGIVDNLDFVTYDIPVEKNYASRQQLIMDPTTTRIYLKAIANTRALGRVVSYIETDFRGYHNSLRLRLAYISFKGFLFGRNVTTFCDLNASPNTVDFEGPNAYNFNFNTMIRYSHSFNKHWSVAIAAELPQLSATYSYADQVLLASIPQRIPDFPLYVQYNWGKNGNSHLRASAVFRNMYYYSLVDEKTCSQFGWGVQLSGNAMLGRKINLLFNGIYGEGITPYIQDISGAGLDLVPNPYNTARMETLPMYGWFAAAQYNFTRKLFVSGGYSWVKVDTKNDFSMPNFYKEAQYIFGNIFYHITPNCQVALEYLYGTRTDHNGQKGCANRIQAEIQYNF